ncbi:hypothetical protein [Rhodanobacter sp. Root480]|uniref:PP_RS20740 family protein n=1 Tax=Rhodanobacter sp. Root480 TaxID=1736542 RepID=UPI000A8B215B|nr:hypothetical protein [Rhodanobacter sp. Root480]
MATDTEMEKTQDELGSDDLTSVFGTEDVRPHDEGLRLKNDFLPWHRPVKQLVRKEQWAALAVRLVKDSKLSKLRYLTLPGADMFDVRVIAETCAQEGCKVEYLGFDSSRSGERGVDQLAAATANAAQRDTAESVLRQTGLVTDSSITLNDFLEDIAVSGSQACAILRNFGHFDIVNIDACDHLAVEPVGERPGLFSAVKEVFSHQRGRHSPWLLYVTTRVSPDRLGGPKEEFVDAIKRNLDLPTDVFRNAFAEAMGVSADDVEDVVSDGWAIHDDRLLKLFSIGLGKYLLQLAHGHYGDPAKVELASCYCYRVHEGSADMLALAFRITPTAKRIAQPTIGGGVLNLPLLEPVLAARVANKVVKLVDLDRELAEQPDLAEGALAATLKLLEVANYNLDEYREWLEKNERPTPTSVVRSAVTPLSIVDG